MKYFCTLLIALVFVQCKNSKTPETVVDAVAESEMEQIKQLETHFTEATDSAGKHNEASKLIEAYSNFSIAHPDHEKAALSLMKQAELTENVMGDYQEAFGLYNEVSEKYPDSKLAGRALMMQGMITYSFFGNTMGGLAFFAKVCERFPNTDECTLASQMIEQHDLSGQQLMDKIKQEQP